MVQGRWKTGAAHFAVVAYEHEDERRSTPAIIAQIRRALRLLMRKRDRRGGCLSFLQAATETPIRIDNSMVLAGREETWNSPPQLFTVSLPTPPVRSQLRRLLAQVGGVHMCVALGRGDARVAQ